MTKNIKQQIKLTAITLLQTLLFISGLMVVILTVSSIFKQVEAEGSGLYTEIPGMIYLALSCGLVPALLAYIPAKFALREKGTIRGVMKYDAVYYNKSSHRVRYGTFDTWAEFNHKVNLVWYLLSPVAFILQLVSLVIAFIAPYTKNIYSEIGLKDYSKLKNEKNQWLSNFLFNFVVVDVEKEDTPVAVGNTPLEEGSADDDIITLTNADGEEVDFTEIAGIAYGGNFYAILQPVELLENMDDDEALVFKVSRGANGEDKFEIELDDDVIEAVFAEYNRLLDQQH